MKNILNEEEREALRTMVNGRGEGVAVLKKLFRKGILELKDVETINPKGNVGLQTCSRQEALKIVRDVFTNVFPDLAEKKAGAEMENEDGVSDWG